MKLLSLSYLHWYTLRNTVFPICVIRLVHHIHAIFPAIMYISSANSVLGMCLLIVDSFGASITESFRRVERIIVGWVFFSLSKSLASCIKAISSIIAYNLSKYFIIFIVANCVVWLCCPYTQTPTIHNFALELFFPLHWCQI